MQDLVDHFKEKIKHIFSNLTDPEQIAEMCKQRNIQGFQRNTFSCPMVKLVREELPLNIGFVMGKRLGTGKWILFYGAGMESMPAPRVCDLFSDKFDSGLYPELVA